MWSTRRGPQDAVGLSKSGAARRHVPARLGVVGGSTVGGDRLFQFEQLNEEDGLVAARASATQPYGATKKSARWATTLAERAFSARRTLVDGVGDQRPPTLQVATQLTEIDDRQRLMAEAIGTLLTGRLFTIDGATAPRRASAYWAGSWG